MLRFFSKIRKSLLAEGKTTKYLTYAVGEISLVVIGILIALSINNWNDRRIKNKSETDFYRKTKTQLLDDASNIQGLINYNNRHSQQFKYASEIIETQNFALKDTLARISTSLINYSDFDRQGNIYESLVNSGNINILKNDEIIDQLRRLEETYLYLNRLENIHLEVVLTLAQDLMTNIKLSTGEVQNNAILFGYQFQNNFIMSLHIMDEKRQIYERALSEINSLVRLLDQELADRE